MKKMLVFQTDFTYKEGAVAAMYGVVKSVDEDIEIMCHPGYCDLELYKESSYSLNRVKELAVLCDEKVINFVKDNGIELAHY